MAATKPKIRFSRVLASKVNASKRNDKRSRAYHVAKFGEDFTEERSRKAGNACLAKYGRDFYRHLRSLRKKQPKHAVKVTI